MFRNYLLLALRNMRKNKLHTFINIGGMTVAFACSIFILLMVYRHLTYDNFELNKNSINTRGRLVRYGDKTLDMSTTMVDPDFLKMFTFPVIKGNTANPLSDVSNTVLT